MEYISQKVAAYGQFVLVLYGSGPNPVFMIINMCPDRKSV